LDPAIAKKGARTVEGYTKRIDSLGRWINDVSRRMTNDVLRLERRIDRIEERLERRMDRRLAALDERVECGK
jgi:hypothetical protein